MLGLLNKFKSKTTLKEPKPFDKTVLFRAINTAFDDFASETADESLDRLIAQTGKSRHEILDAILNDDEIEACREDIESAIRATPFVLWGDTLDENSQNELIKWIMPHIKTFAMLAMLAKWNGHAIAEYVYKHDDKGRIVIDKVLNREGELGHYKFKRDGTVLFDDNGRDVPIETTVKNLVLTHRASPARPMGQMMIIKAYPSVLLRGKNWAFLGQFIKRYAQPYVVGKQGGFSMIESFTARLFEFINGGATGIGADDDISIHQLSADGGAFDMAERMANSRIQKLLLGRVKTSELSSGSRASQETDDKTRIDRIGSYLELTAEAINHALNAMIAVNAHYGTPLVSGGQVWFDWKNEKAVDKTRAERDKLYLDTGTIVLTSDYYKDVVGFEEHHFKIVEPSPTNEPQNMPLSMLLSDTHDDTSHGHNHDDDEPLSDRQIKIANDKAEKVLALVKDVDDFATFQKRLENLDLTDDDFVDELANQNLTAYVGGLTGKSNQDGQTGV